MTNQWYLTAPVDLIEYAHSQIQRGEGLQIEF